MITDTFSEIYTHFRLVHAANVGKSKLDIYPKSFKVTTPTLQLTFRKDFMNALMDVDKKVNGKWVSTRFSTLASIKEECEQLTKDIRKD